MMPHDFMTLHAAKMVEYLIAVSYLLLFIPFWRYVTGTPAHLTVLAHERKTMPAPSEWFTMPAGLFYHPGHAWLRVENANTATVGFDDFAGKLVGTPSAITLPAVGAPLVQGERAWSLVVDGKSIDMLSPVDGTVVAVNEQARRSPAIAHDRPYADGWLLKVTSARLTGNLKQLMTGRLVQRWVSDLTDSLGGHLAPAVGAVSADGGVVVDGLARSLEPAAWDDVARRYFLTELAATPGKDASEDNGGDHA